MSGDDLSRLLLLDENDRYATKWKTAVSSDDAENFLETTRCFLCSVLLSSHSFTCGKCEQTFNFCDTCCTPNDVRMFCCPAACIFCMRKQNDEVVRRLGGTLLPLSQDFYGHLAVRHALETAPNVAQAQ